MLSIHKAGIEDIELIRILTMQVWPQTYVPILGEEQVKYMLDTMYNEQELQQQIQNGQQYLICYDDEQPVGFASYSQTEAQVYKLNKIYILPGVQGKGIGKFVIDYVVNELSAKKATALDLNVNRYNGKAQSFYERYGFRVLRVEDIDIGKGYYMNDYVLRYDIK